MPPPSLEEEDPNYSEVAVVLGFNLRKHNHLFTAAVGCQSYILVS
jgi:hypothetical protein